MICGTYRSYYHDKNYYQLIKIEHNRFPIETKDGDQEAQFKSSCKTLGQGEAALVDMLAMVDSGRSGQKDAYQAYI